jgi:uncharacterized protein YndB with AHSA1/START domain
MTNAISGSQINHQVGVKAPPEEVYKHLTETAKLAQWWTTDTRGSGARVGDTLDFWFYGRFCQQFDVKELEPGKRVAWKSPKGQGADQWEETEVSFDLSTDEKQTLIQFRHSGWRESTGFQGHCSMRWAVFLLSLKDVLERGKGRPIPYDLEVDYR